MSIKTRFDKASTTYDTVATHQKQAATFLVKKIVKFMPQNPQKILDLGTGTGYMTELLYPKFSQASFYLNDISPNMLEVCKKKFSKNKSFFYLPGSMLDLEIHGYDCIVSNLALQWVDVSFLDSIFKKKPRLFAFSTLYKSTFQEWYDIINQYEPITMNYPTKETLIYRCTHALSSNQVFNFWVKDIPLVHENAYDFMRYIQNLGASKISYPLSLKTLKKIRSRPGPITTTYKLFFGILRTVH